MPGCNSRSLRTRSYSNPETWLAVGTVERMTTWQTKIGAEATRAELSQIYGDQGMSGIQTPTKSRNIFVYSDPARGQQHGYTFDGWNSDGSIFRYTGAGPVGDQVLLRGNKVLANQPMSGLPVRLFVAVGNVPKSGTKIHRYLGEFRTHSDHPYSVQRNVDRAGNLRRVYVFNLVRVGDAEQRPEDYAPDEHVDETAGYYEAVSLAQNKVTNFDRRQIEPSVAEKREENLVTDFERSLKDSGAEVGRFKIYPPGSTSPLFTDICDLTHNVLYEAKAGSTRGYVREALGQVLDYRRFVDDATKCRVLLPEEPTPDLASLLLAYGVGVVWPDSGGTFNLLEPDAMLAT